MCACDIHCTCIYITYMAYQCVVCVKGADVVGGYLGMGQGS